MLQGVEILFLFESYERRTESFMVVRIEYGILLSNFPSVMDLKRLELSSLVKVHSVMERVEIKRVVTQY